MFGTPGVAQLLIVGLIVLLLFGNRLPSVMRSLGEGITEFKKGIRSEDSADSSSKIEDKNDTTAKSRIVEEEEHKQTVDA